MTRETSRSLNSTDILGSTISRDSLAGQAKASQALTLTILAHPDARRIGDRAVLSPQAPGWSAHVSRLEPRFTSTPGDARRPLADKHVSRLPLLLALGSDETEVVVKRGQLRTRVEIDGAELAQEHRVAFEDLAAGVTLLLAERVALLLHLSPVAPRASGGEPMGMVGESPAVIRLRSEIRSAGPHDVPVLILGETGTGKELVARAIHSVSPRSMRPFVAVNLGALAPNLAAAELFGATRGAFTGADKQRTGFFQRAAGGTLFLDEIGEAPLDVQVMLLRTLESSEIQPVGSSIPVEVDVRIVAATDAELISAVSEGRFRAPLLHRLAGYEIEVPSLRQRREDVGRLLYHFLAQELERIGQGHQLASAAASGTPWPPAKLVARMARAAWPGNIRQLRNLARRLAIAGSDLPYDRVEALVERGSDEGKLESDEPRPPRDPRPNAGMKPARRPAKSYRPPHEVSDDELVAALSANRWSLKPAARQLGVSRASLYVLIDRCSLVRKASTLEVAEIQASRERCGGDLDHMAEDLKVSRHGLQLRIRKLELSFL